MTFLTTVRTGRTNVRSVSAVGTELALLLMLALLLLLAPSDSELDGLTPRGVGVNCRYTYAPAPVRSPTRPWRWASGVTYDARASAPVDVRVLPLACRAEARKR